MALVTGKLVILSVQGLLLMTLTTVYCSCTGYTNMPLIRNSFVAINAADFTGVYGCQVLFDRDIQRALATPCIVASDAVIIRITPGIEHG
jgi:uncharacterized membrane protein YjfL (UPF0719 family)